ncbi:MAG TPA: DUF4956 domain-containing protein [Longimicrobiales bacterium]|nr:DUF4956 domain-containing protein [Longimicrobiales bacterium]
MSARDVLKSPALRLIAYFAILGTVLGVLALAVPWFATMLIPTPPGAESIPGVTGGMGPATSDWARTAAETAVVGLLSLLGALLFTVPIVWIYTVIMRQEGYDQSFVRLLASLPVVVAGVVQVVRGDLALAFALAGIVAAVRFRTTVKDLQDAVFAFAAIGVGLAAGTGNFTLAGALSTVFCLLGWVLWHYNVGDVEPSLELGHAGVTLSEALVPGESHKAVVIGDDDMAEPVHAKDLEELSDHIDRLADYVRADALRKKKKYNTLLLVHTDDPEGAAEFLEPILDEHARRWVLVDTIRRNGTGMVAMEYLMRLKKKVKVGQMIDHMDCGPDSVCQAAELKPIKGLRKRLT